MADKWHVVVRRVLIEDHELEADTRDEAEAQALSHPMAAKQVKEANAFVQAVRKIGGEQ